MPAARSIIGLCPECCNCPTPQAMFYPRITVSCASRSGTATLYGFSGYDTGSYNPSDPWAWEGQMQKWSDREIQGDYYAADLGGVCDWNWNYVFSGTATLVEAGFTQYGKFNSHRQDAPVCVVSQVVVDQDITIHEDDAALIAYGTCSPDVGHQVGPTVESLTRRVFEGCASWDWWGSGHEQLSGPQSLYDALGGAADDPIGSCCAYTSSATVTEPLSITPIEIVGRASRLTILVEGLPATTYSFRLRLSHQNLDNPSEEIEDTYVELSATTDSEGIAEIEYDIEQPAPGRSTCYAGVEADAYQFRFKRPRVGSGKCYRLTWVERLYDPEVGMSIISIPVAKGGSGYTTAPEVTIDPPDIAEDDGGVQAEATAVVTDGRVTAINVTVAGAGYFGRDVDWWNGYVGVTIAPPDGEGGKQAVAGCVRLSGDTEREWEWDGEVPEGYDPEDPETWLLTEVHTVTVPDGWRWHLACVSSECRGCA